MNGEYSDVDDAGLEPSVEVGEDDLGDATFITSTQLGGSGGGEVPHE